MFCDRVPSAGEGVEGSSPSVSGLAAAVSRMRSELEASLSGEGRDDDGGDVNYAILAGQVVDALVAEQIRSAGGRAQQGPAGASPGVEAAVQGVVECAKLCHDAGAPPISSPLSAPHLGPSDNYASEFSYFYDANSQWGDKSGVHFAWQRRIPSV